MPRSLTGGLFLHPMSERHKNGPAQEVVTQVHPDYLAGKGTVSERNSPADQPLHGVSNMIARSLLMNHNAAALENR